MTEQAWEWTASGSGLSASPGAMQRSFETSGVVWAEGVGEVIEWLAAASPAWDGADQQSAMSFQITPLGNGKME